MTSRKPKPCEENRRKCSVCDRTFYAYPSDKKKSCSKRACRTTSMRRSCITHGQSGTRLYRIWKNMRQRCNGTADERTNRYYRHVSCDPTWVQFKPFYEWAKSSGYQDTLEIDRIDPRKGYCPSNCRWATRSQQMQNVRWHICRNKTSIFKGVQRVKQCRKPWRALGNNDGRPIQLGLYSTQLEAALVYDAWAKEAYGEFARVNFSAAGGASS